MEGVTILNTIAYQENSKGYYALVLIISLFCIVSCVYMLMQTIKDSEGIVSILFSTIPLILSLLLFVSSTAKLAFYDDPQYAKTRHEALISDGVDLKEFSEKYKIIEIRGEIYTIEEIGEEK